VIFQVKDSIYNQQLVITNIPYTSVNNTITFQGNLKDSSKVVINFPATSTNNFKNYALLFDSCRYVTLKNISVLRLGGSSKGYSNAIAFAEHSEYNSILGCRIFSSGAGYGITHTVNSKKNLGGNIIRGNYFSRGGIYNGDANYSLAKVYETGNIIQNNVIDTGDIVAHNQDALIIQGNTLKCGSISVSYFQNSVGPDASKISENYVHSDNWSTSIFSIGGSSLMSSNKYPTDISNNQIILFEGNEGLKLDHLDKANICYNSVSMRFLSTYNYSTGYGLIYSYLKNSNILNNIIFTSGKASAILSSGTLLNTRINYNSYFTRSAIFGYNNGSISSFASWKTTTSLDSNSIYYHPKFVDSSTNLHILPYLSSLDGKGVPFKNISRDFDGELRDTLTPDIGADEFTPVNRDIAVISIDSLQKIGCGGTKNIVITITNKGSDTLKSADFKFYINGILKNTFHWKGLLASQASRQISIGTYTYSTLNYLVSITSSNPNGKPDQVIANDSLTGSAMTTMAGKFTIGGASSDYYKRCC
jgi:hypothetical protein